MERQVTNGFIAGVYTVGTFSVQNPTPAQQQEQANAARDLATSGMGVVLLASFHVHADGSIWWNGTEIAAGGQASAGLNPNLAGLLRQISAGGATLLASFGGGGDFDGHAVGYLDFTNIKNLDATYSNQADNPFYQNLAVLFSSYDAIAGLDNDLEVYGDYSPFLGTVNTLNAWLKANGRISTIAPFDDPDFWVSVVQQSGGPGNNAYVSWVNLQNAGATLSPFIPPLQAVWSDVPPHLLAGLQIDTGTMPGDVQGTFCQVGQQASGLRGGWLWTYENFTGPASAYATAIQQGLAGTGC
jgi:hypothetical protein